MSSAVGVYAKAVGGTVAAGLTAAVTALNDGTIDRFEWLTVVATAVVALGAIWAIPATPAPVRRAGKAIGGAVVAGIGALGTAWVDGVVAPADLVTIALAVLAALGVTYAVPNAKTSDGTTSVSRAVARRAP